MAVRAAARRAPPATQAPTTGGELNYKLLVRETGLKVKDITEIKASALYDMCRVKSNQVMMMKRRGYEISPEEAVWVDCSLDESKLIAHMRTLTRKTERELLGMFKKTYTINRLSIPDQTTFNFYPYVRAGEETSRIGEFFFREGKWDLFRDEDEILRPQEFQTEVEFTDRVDISSLSTQTFSQVSRKIIVFTDTEKNFSAEMKKMIQYRKRNVELFHMSELFVDYFQHWLVPEQRVLTDAESITLLSPYIMLEDEEGTFQKQFNCKITKTALPSIHFTDVVMRYIGALPGKIVYWENRSYISSFSSVEFGYMQVTGFKYNENETVTAERQTFAGEQREEEDGGEEDEEDVGEEDVGEEDVEEDED
jgi:DNA-directed RNA polymerase subunit H (RpoH/RPB5)